MWYAKKQSVAKIGGRRVKKQNDERLVLKAEDLEFFRKSGNEAYVVVVRTGG